MEKKKLNFADSVLSVLKEVDLSHTNRSNASLITIKPKLSFKKSKFESLKSLLDKYSLNSKFEILLDETEKEDKSKHSSGDSISQANQKGSIKSSLSTQGNHFYYNDIMFSMVQKFNKVFETYYLDINFNNNDTYEDYIVNNLKVIKTMQFFLLQTDYDSQFTAIQAKLHQNYKFDYDAPYIIFDLDETLVHSEPYSDDLDRKYSATNSLKVVDDLGVDKAEIIGIFVRPCALELLKFCKEHFKLILFTAADISYANSVLEACNMTAYFDLVLDKSYTIMLKNFYLKDLSLFNFDQKLNCLIIDNNIFSFASSLGQGVLVSSFYGDASDDELLETIKFLKESIVPDMLNMIINNSEYHMYEELMNKLNISLLEEN